MRRIHKILLGLAITSVILIAGPITVAAASGQGEALKGLIQTLKYNWKCLVSTLDANVEAWTEFLGAI